MKRFLFVLISVLYLCSSALAVPAEFDVYDTDELLADDPELEEVEIVEEVVYETVYVSGDPLDGSITDVQVMSLNPITPEDTSGLKAVLLDLIGDYDAVVVEYEYSGSNGYTNYVREIQPDYVWLCSCGLFAIVIYCLFRLGGALLRD